MIDLVISREHQVLSALAQVPDEEWLQLDLTKDQKQYWYQLKEGQTKLTNELHAYFNGQETTLTNKKKDRELGIIADYYISLYSLIQIGFPAIKKSFQAVYCPPDLAEIEELKTPGSLFKVLIYCEALLLFSLCLKGEYTWTPSGALKEHKLINILRDRSIPKHKRLQAWRQLKPNFMELFSEFYLHQPRDLVIDTCRKEAPKNPRLKRKLEEFNRCFDLLEKTSSKNLRKKSKGFGFRKGQRIYPSRYGGTWKTSAEILENH